VNWLVSLTLRGRCFTLLGVLLSFYKFKSLLCAYIPQFGFLDNLSVSTAYRIDVVVDLHLERGSCIC